MAQSLKDTQSAYAVLALRSQSIPAGYDAVGASQLAGAPSVPVQDEAAFA